MAHIPSEIEQRPIAGGLAATHRPGNRSTSGGTGLLTRPDHLAAKGPTLIYPLQQCSWNKWALRPDSRQPCVECPPAGRFVKPAWRLLNPKALGDDAPFSNNKDPREWNRLLEGLALSIFLVFNAKVSFKHATSILQNRMKKIFHSRAKEVDKESQQHN